MDFEICLITKEFPYGHLEDSFVRPELPFLQEKHKVLVAASEMKEMPEKTADLSVPAVFIPSGQSTADKIISFLSFLTEPDCYRELGAILKAGEKVPGRMFRALMFGTAAETFYRRLKKATGLQKDTKAVFYFYWFDYKCFGLTMHKRKYPGIRIIARTHGYDLFDGRELYGKQFFQPQMDRELTRLIFAAQYAKDYYLKRYRKANGEKYPLCRLGVPDKGDQEPVRREKYEKGQPFLLLSCSRAVKIKRIERIIDGLEILSERKMPNHREIMWIHIGGGEELESLQQYAQEKLNGRGSIRYQFFGALSNEEVNAFYGRHLVGAFITTTETEGGAPVSVQEALSYGVPVIAAAVGELQQMVRGNGFLLSEEAQGAEVADAIERMALLYGDESYWKLGQSSYRLFREHFDGARNFQRVAEEIERIKTE